MISESETLKRIIPPMRRGVERCLAVQRLTGVEVPEAAGGRISSWWHRPAKTADQVEEAGRCVTGLPVLFELHGGGFALGDPRKGDALRTWMAGRYGVHVVGVGYRLAPEDPWPAALNDVVETLSYFAQCAGDYGMDPRQFFLLGYSAGANLALASCFKLQEESDPGFRVQGLLLHYPFLDAAVAPEDLPARTEDLPVEMMNAFNSWYVTDNDPEDPFISPAFATLGQLAELPRVIQYPVEGDVLAPSAHALHRRLQAAGAQCSLHAVENAYHGYLEDASNLYVYRRTSLVETIAARPADFAQTAARVYEESLDELLGGPKCDVRFDPEHAEEAALRLVGGRATELSACIAESILATCGQQEGMCS